MHDDGLTILYRTYGAIIYGRCRDLLKDDAEAEDATHETFLRVRRYLQRLASPQEAVFLIYRIATNYCLSELRTRKHRPAPDSETLEQLPATVGADPEHRLADRDLVQHMVDLVPSHLKSVAWLYHVDGFDQAEVASILGISRRTVIKQLQLFVRNARKFARRNGL